MSARTASPSRPVTSGRIRLNRSRVRTIAYWATTLVVLFELVSGAVWNLTTIEWTVVQLAHLGYPDYFVHVLGVVHVAAAVAVVAPGFPVLKEWAYAGTLFMWTGAVVSHLSRGDGLQSWGAPLMFALFGVASWALRPADRRINRTEDRERTETSPRAWAVPVALLAALFAFSLLTLPVVEDVMHENAVRLGWIEE